MRAIVTTSQGDYIEVELEEPFEFKCYDIERTLYAEGVLAFKPVIVPGEPLVMATEEGTVKNSGWVRGVIYRG